MQWMHLKEEALESLIEERLILRRARELTLAVTGAELEGANG